jgi:membrane protein implicated in regulation of membrane protease activity
MAAPLFLMAYFWDRLDLGHRRWLRGREISLGKFRLHTTNLLSGLMFITLGVIFIAYEGTSSLSSFYESNGATDLAFAAEQWASDLARRVPGTALFVAAAVLFAALLLRRFLRREEQKESVEHRR